MKKENLLQLLLPIGLLIVCCTPLLNHYMPLPDFLSGFLQGVGLGLMLVVLIKKWKLKRAGGSAER